MVLEKKKRQALPFTKWVNEIYFLNAWLLKYIESEWEVKELVDFI